MYGILLKFLVFLGVIAAFAIIASKRGDDFHPQVAVHPQITKSDPIQLSKPVAVQAVRKPAARPAQTAKKVPNQKRKLRS